MADSKTIQKVDFDALELALCEHMKDFEIEASKLCKTDRLDKEAPEGQY